MNARDRQIGMGLLDAQQHPKPRAGNIPEFVGIQNDRRAVFAFQFGKDLPFNLGGIAGIDPSVQCNRDRHKLSPVVFCFVPNNGAIAAFAKTPILLLYLI